MTVQDYKNYFSLKYWRTSSFTTGLCLGICDCLMIMISIGFTFFVINFINDDYLWLRKFLEYGLFLPPMILVFYAAGLYPGILLPPADEIKKFSICLFFGFCGIGASIFIDDGAKNERWPMIIGIVSAIPVAIVLIPMGREIARRVFGKLRWYGVPAVIYSNGDSCYPVIQRLINRPDYGYKPAIIIDKQATAQTMYKDIPVFPSSDELLSVIKKTGIKVAILCDYHEDMDKINSNYRYTLQIPQVQDVNNISTDVRDMGGILGFSSTHNLTKITSLALKRFVDLFLLLISAWATIPLTLVVAFLVKITSKGPVFYGHKRIGKNGKEFKCWKFRSMVIDADKQLEKILAENPEMRKEWERSQKFENDPRVTKIGNFLRKTSIDEIPQFFNVLTGEMSFIGPRPVTKPELEKYGKKADYILSVKPGLSGMWQISGRSETSYEERVTLDSYYIQNWSVWLDMWIILKTVFVVLKGKGAY